MEPYQAALADAFPVLLDHLDASLDFHVGAVSTDCFAPGSFHEVDGRTFIDRDTADPASAFRALVTMGTRGDITERGLCAVQEALSPYQNNDFRRTDAALRTIVLSNEPDSSTTSVEAFVAWYVGLAPDVTFSSIVTVQAPYVGVDYLIATLLIGGSGADITSEDYGQVMADVALLGSAHPTVFFLAGRPDPATLKVTVDDPSGAAMFGRINWTYDPEENALNVASPLLTPGWIVTVTYCPADGAGC